MLHNFFSYDLNIVQNIMNNEIIIQDIQLIVLFFEFWYAGKIRDIFISKLSNATSCGLVVKAED
jgi:hypothetical protein